MASRLSQLASAASAYIRRRTGATTEPEGDERQPPGLLGTLASMFSRQRRPRRPAGPPRPPQPPGDWMLSEEGAPPRQAFPPPVPPPVQTFPPRVTGYAPDADDDQEQDEQERFDDITIFGRDLSYDQEDWARVQTGMRLVNSSNVYGYFFQLETRTSGILYVQYLDYVPRSLGGTGQRSGPGPTYAYYDIPLSKYRQFERMAETSAGSAVWDYCRVRGSVWEHQHTYRLVQVSGEYVPRKVTAMGFARRNVAAIGIGRRQRSLRQGGHARMQLPRNAGPNRGQPNRGQPNRGRPDRGEPNRGG